MLDEVEGSSSLMVSPFRVLTPADRRSRTFENLVLMMEDVLSLKLVLFGPFEIRMVQLAKGAATMLSKTKITMTKRHQITSSPWPN